MNKSLSIKLMYYNHFDRRLTNKEIEEGEHRKFVGSFSKEIGELQFKLLISNGLRPNHKLLDIACGSLRRGFHFIKYLNKSNNAGINGIDSLLKEARFELKSANLESKNQGLY